MSFRKEAFGMILVILAEFLLGIYTTFFVHFPEGATEMELWTFSEREMILSAHIILGVILTIGTVRFFIRVLRQKQPSWTASATTAFIGVLLATTTGFIFIPTQNDLYSLLMGVGFSVAIAGYGWGIYRNE